MKDNQERSLFQFASNILFVHWSQKIIKVQGNIGLEEIVAKRTRAKVEKEQAEKHREFVAAVREARAAELAHLKQEHERQLAETWSTPDVMSLRGDLEWRIRQLQTELAKLREQHERDVQ